MNRTLRTALAAATLSLGLTLTAGLLTAGTGHAATPAGPGVSDVAAPDRDGPRPAPRPPVGPGDLADDRCPTHGGCTPEDPADGGPDDLQIPDPEPTRPDGPGDLTGTPPCPRHGGCGDPGDDPTGDSTGDPTGEPGGDSSGELPPSEGDIPLPTRIDTGAGGPAGGTDPAWLLAGALLLTVTGAALAGSAGATRGRR